MILLWAAAQAIALSLILATPVYADDCLSDPLNAADCMRTTGFRQVISALVSLGGTIAVILINTLSNWAATLGGATGAAAAGGAPAAGAAAGSTAGPTTGGPPPPAPVHAPPPPVTQPPPPPPDQAPGAYETAEGAVVGATKSNVFDLIKNLTGPASTVIGSLTEWFTFPDGPEVVKNIRNAMNAWRNNPSKEAAEEYIKSIRGTRDMRLKNLADKLDLLSKGVDLVDALGTGLDKANERGFTGVDKVLTVSAEIGKKTLAWMLTKNPAVGLVDGALGGATEMLFGKQGRIDIGGTIDKGADAWDKTTQEYFANTQGVTDADANLQTQDQFLSGLRRIKEQFKDGKLTREEASQRMRRLRDRMFGGDA